MIRRQEQELDVEHLDPVAAIRRLAEVTFDHHEAHPDFIRLVSIENIHEAEHIAASATLGSLNSPAITVIEPDPGGGPRRRRLHQPTSTPSTCTR